MVKQCLDCGWTTTDDRSGNPDLLAIEHHLETGHTVVAMSARSVADCELEE